MPADFLKCQRNGGRVRTITGPDKKFSLEKGEYRHICVLNGEVFLGETKTKKNNNQA